MQSAFDIPLWVSGVATAVLAGSVFFGGIGRLDSVTEKLVPVISATNLIGASVVIGIKYCLRLN